MKKELRDALVEQFNFELESGYIYKAMELYFELENMKGFAHFMNRQAAEEVEHAEKMYHFLLEMDEAPEYKAIPKPDTKGFKGFKEVFQLAYEHEQEVSKRVRKIYELAKKDGSHEVEIFMQWFVKEQVEEEDNFRDILTTMERINNNWGGLYIYDHELGQRQ